MKKFAYINFLLYFCSRKSHDSDCDSWWMSCKIKTDAEPWQGTLVFMELHTDKEINPNAVVANRTDCISQYNEEFLEKTNIEDLW